MEGSYKKLWVKAQQMADAFWVRWRKEYLPTLLPRAKWQHESEPLQKGDVVIVINNLVPRNMWTKGVIDEIIEGDDSRTRSAMVKTCDGFLKRPLVKLIKLDEASKFNNHVRVRIS